MRNYSARPLIPNRKWKNFYTYNGTNGSSGSTHSRQLRQKFLRGGLRTKWEADIRRCLRILSKLRGTVSESSELGQDSQI